MFTKTFTNGEGCIIGAGKFGTLARNNRAELLENDSSRENLQEAKSP